MTGHRLTRRRVLAAGAGAGLAAVGLPAPAHARQELAILRGLAVRERTLVTIWDSAAKSGLFGPRAARTMRRIRDQEREHLDLLEEQAARLGGSVAGERPRAGEVPGLERAVVRVRMVELAAAEEEAAVSAYVEALSETLGPETGRSLAGIAGNQAQHLSFARRMSGQDPVPSALFPADG